MAISVIRTEKLAKSFVQGKISVSLFEQVDAIFTQGETYAILGVSGAGKSTLVHILAGLEEPTSGSVFFNGKNLSAFTSKEKQALLNRSFGLVFQSPYLIAELSVIENVMMPGLVAGIAYDICRARAQELLTVVGLSEKTSSNPLTLSGGQQQRVAIMRALYNKPEFLFADEPTGNLDEKTGREVLSFLLECQKTWNMGLIIGTHDTYVAESMEVRYVLHNGRLTSGS